MLVFGIIDFGFGFHAWNNTANAAREGARKGAVDSSPTDIEIRTRAAASTLDQAKQAASQLRQIGSPFLNWSGKAEGTSFDVPTLPLFVHERLSTQAILETLKRHEANPQEEMFDLFGGTFRLHCHVSFLLKSMRSARFVVRETLGGTQLEARKTDFVAGCHRR